MDVLNEQPPGSIRLLYEHWEAMRADAAARAPQEACGLVAGIGERAVEVIPVANALHSPTRFLMDAREQAQAFRRLEAHSWRLLAIYHSHPRGPEGLSRSDLDEAAYPEVLNLVWTVQDEEWNCRAFRIEAGEAIEVPVVVSGAQIPPQPPSSSSS